MAHGLSASDRSFRERFEACTIPPAEFDHRAHVRLAYVHLAEQNVDTAHERVREGLRKFLVHNRIDVSKYHETITRAWIMAVRLFMDRTDDTDSADGFIDRNPQILDARIMLTHYSAEVLFSDEARSRFVEPDLDPIPPSG